MDLADVQRVTGAAGSRFALTHVSRINTPVLSHSDQGAGHADPIPSMSITTPWPHGLHALLALVLLVGLSACGSPSPEGPRSSPTSGSADAVVAIPAGDAPRAGLAARQVPTLTSPLGPPAPAAERRSPDASRATSPAPAASPTTSPPSDAQTPADQAQHEARELWFAELRESPDATVRLQALEQWAQQPGDTINPLTYALVDEDEAVRARAEALYAQQRAREEAETAL